MLDANLKAQLKGYLARLSLPVEIVASADESDKSREMLERLSDIESLSPLVSLGPQREAAQTRPSFALRRPGGEARIRFAGVPLGHEFTSLVLALLHTGGHPPKADPAALEQAQRRGVLAVPAVFLNGRPFAQRRMELTQILAKLAAPSSTGEVERLNSKLPYDVLVVGGGPAGVAAAIYAARKGIRTGVAAERLGGQLQDTLSIENFISVAETQGHALATGLERHVAAYEVDTMRLQRAAQGEVGGGRDRRSLARDQRAR